MSRWLKTFMRASGPETFVGEWAGGPDERSEEANGPEAFVGEWAGGLCGRVGRRPLWASGPETFAGEWAGDLCGRVGRRPLWASGPKALMSGAKKGCRTGIRTPVSASRARRPTTRRSGNSFED